MEIKLPMIFTFEKDVASGFFLGRITLNFEPKAQMWNSLWHYINRSSMRLSTMVIAASQLQNVGHMSRGPFAERYRNTISAAETSVFSLKGK